MATYARRTPDIQEQTMPVGVFGETGRLTFRLGIAPAIARELTAHGPVFVTERNIRARIDTTERDWRAAASGAAAERKTSRHPYHDR
jgi:hypothetical protein